MAFIRGFIKTYENVASFKTWSLLSKLKQHEIPLAAKKLDLPLPIRKPLSISSKESAKKLDAPLPPKKPLSAYMIFLTDNREKLVKERPDLHTTEVVKTLAEQWNQLSITAREPFQKRARAGTLAYAEEHKRYLENLTEDQKAAILRHKSETSDSKHLKKLKKALKDNDYPKAPTSAYALFVQSESKTSENKDPKIFLKKIAEKWNSLSESSKQKFRDQSEKYRAEYPAILEKWRLEMEARGLHELVHQCDELNRPTSAKLAGSENDTSKRKKKETVQQNKSV